MSVSVICACKNRNHALQISLNSWLNFKEITEIIIVDWSSDDPLEKLTFLDERIKIIRVNDKIYFNQTQPLNLAISLASGDKILKLDTDYVLNPYYNFFETYLIDDNSFVSGHNESDILKQNVNYINDGNYHRLYQFFGFNSDYYKYLIGLLYITKENLLKIGGYNENLGKYYAYEDDEICKRLELLGLNHNKLDYDHRIHHMPHPCSVRTENFEGDGELNSIVRKNLSEYYEGQKLDWEVDYAISTIHIERNKDMISEITESYVKPNTEWDLQKISDQYYIAIETQVKKEKIMQNKLNNFPSIYYISLEESEDRRTHLHDQFLSYGIGDLNSIISKRFDECNDKVYGEQLHILDGGTTGCVISHLKAIQKWYNETDEDCGFFCEDDLSLETIEHWNFTWEDFVQSLPENAECVQLTSIRPSHHNIYFRERSMYDWSVTAYIITRDYAQKILQRHVFGDEYNLTIPGTQFYPMPETVLFYGLGNVYTVELFVETNNAPSTFKQIESGHKEYHNESYEFVSNWWKNNGKITSLNKILGLSEIKSEITIEKLLTQYSLDTENPEYNFELGLWYEKRGHTAPALSYFLRCAERADDLLAYEALIQGSICYDRQGTREGTAKGLLQQALCLIPTRPEAYFLLAQFSEKRQWWQDCYIYADNGLRFADLNSAPLKTDIGYPGTYGLLFQKAVSGWWWGKNEQSGKIFKELYENYALKEEYRKVVLDNLTNYFPNYLSTEKSLDIVQVNDLEKMDIVLQGEYEEYTDEIVEEYLKLPFVNNIIVSCWNDDRPDNYHSPRVKYVRSSYPLTPGTCNKNLQITTSFAGIKLCKTKFSAKMRSDQKYDYNSMMNMYEFFMKNHTESTIFVAGLYPSLLFHPRDHIYWGNTIDVQYLFDIPLEYNSLVDKVRIGKYELFHYTNYFTRPETYIGAHYCTKFDDRIKKMLIEPEKYLYDGSPSWNEAYQISMEVLPKAFKAFPRTGIDLVWPKRDTYSYPYDQQKLHSNECWHEDGF